MRCQFGNQPGAKSPEGMGMVGLNIELLSQLTVDGFNNLLHSIKQLTNRFGQLLLLIDARDGEQTQTVVTQQARRQLGTDGPAHPYRCVYPAFPHPPSSHEHWPEQG